MGWPRSQAFLGEEGPESGLKPPSKRIPTPRDWAAHRGWAVLSEGQFFAIAIQSVVHVHSTFIACFLARPQQLPKRPPAKPPAGPLPGQAADDLKRYAGGACATVAELAPLAA